MVEFIGKLIMKIDREGTRSEGPEYFLKLSKPNEFGQIELKIRKKSRLWQKDPELHIFIERDVIITGQSINVKHVRFDKTNKSKSIIYEKVKEFDI